MTGLALSISAAAAEIDVSERFVRDLVNAQKLPAHRVGPKNIRIFRADLEEWLRAQPLVGSEDDPAG